MPLFDTSIIPAECGTSDYVSRINDVIEHLRAIKVAWLSLAGAERTRTLVRSLFRPTFADALLSSRVDTPNSMRGGTCQTTLIQPGSD